MSTSISAIAKAKGLKIPKVDPPSANYQAMVRTGNLIYTAGQISHVNDQPGPIGHLGRELTIETGKLAAQSAALSVLALIVQATDDDLTRFKRMIRVGAFVASAPDFAAHSEIADGASDVFTALFGEAGKHARTSVGVASLPVGVAVEIDAVFELHE